MRPISGADPAPRQPATLRGVLALQVVLSTLLMGSIPVFIRLTHASSFVIGVVRLSIGLLLTLLVFHRRIALGGARSSNGGVGRYLLPVIGLCFGAHWLTYFESIQRSSATLGILALCTYGIHVTWMGALFSNRKPNTHDWVGVLLSAAGAWVCLPSPSIDPDAFVGFLLGMASAVFYAALPLLHQRVAHLSHATRATGQFLFALLLLLPSAPYQNWTLAARDWGLLLVLGVFCTFVAHNLWIAVTTRVRPATSGMLYYLTIPVTMVLDAVLIGSPPSPVQWLGAGLILSGNGYVLWARTRTV